MANALTLYQDPFSYSGAYTETKPGNCLQYLNARYYNSCLMRFISKDSYPQAKKTVFDNTYNYTGGNPIMNEDPSGHVLTGISNGLNEINEDLMAEGRQALKSILEAQPLKPLNLLETAIENPALAEEETGAKALKEFYSSIKISTTNKKEAYLQKEAASYFGEKERARLNATAEDLFERELSQNSQRQRLSVGKFYYMADKPEFFTHITKNYGLTLQELYFRENMLLVDYTHGTKQLISSAGQATKLGQIIPYEPNKTIFVLDDKIDGDTFEEFFEATHIQYAGYWYNTGWAERYGRFLLN